MNRNLTKWIAMALSVLTMLTVGVAVTFAEVGSYIYSYDDMFTKRDLEQTADLKKGGVHHRDQRRGHQHR